MYYRTSRDTAYTDLTTFLRHWASCATFEVTKLGGGGGGCNTLTTKLVVSISSTLRPLSVRPLSARLVSVRNWIR